MSPSKTPALLALAAGVSMVQAHGYVASWTIGGTEFAGFDEQWAVAAGTDTGNEFIAWSESASDNGFISPSAYATADIICHKDATNGVLNNATVAAGDVVTATWNTWPDSHHGPVITYIAAADDPTTVDKSTLEWIKIDAAGLVSGSNPGVWASDEMISNGLAYDITIPSTLKAGNYVMRHEIIALHSASQTDGAQNYPFCVNLQVTGSGTDLPAGTLGTALYGAADAGISFNLYTTFTDYTMPGPEIPSVFGGSGSSDASSSAETTAAAAAAATTTAAAAAATTAAAEATSVAATSAAPAVTSSEAAAAATTTAEAVPATTAAATSKSCKKRRHARQLN